MSQQAWSSPDELAELVSRLGYGFSDESLLKMALAHRSWCAEVSGRGSNERLEFLGDAVLGLVVTERIYADYPDLPEGELAKMRAALVSSEVLSEIASELGLGSAILLGKGEEASGGRHKPSILADALEALIGAVYLDGGWSSATVLVLTLLGARISQAALGPGGSDYKTRLQEVVARRHQNPPSYSVRDEGPDHAKRFYAVVNVAGEALGYGQGRSKKQAEQAAAQEAWERLESSRLKEGGDRGHASLPLPEDPG